MQGIIDHLSSSYITPMHNDGIEIDSAVTPSFDCWFQLNYNECSENILESEFENFLLEYQDLLYQKTCMDA